MVMRGVLLYVVTFASALEAQSTSNTTYLHQTPLVQERLYVVQHEVGQATRVSLGCETQRDTGFHERSICRSRLLRVA